MKKIVAFVLLSLVASSCIKTVKIDLPEYESELFLLGILKPNSVAKVFVNRTSALNDDNSYRYVDNAHVYLFENNLPVDTLLFDFYNEIYTSNFITSPDKTYKIVVKHEGKEARGETAFPDKPAIELLSVEVKPLQSSEPYDPYTYNTTEVKIKIHDNPDKVNYYLIETFNKPANSPEWRPAWLFITPLNDPVIQNEGEFYYSNEFYFNDLIFNGQDYTLTFYLDFEINPGDSLRINFFSAQKEVYLWKKFLKNYGSGSSLNNEPVFMPDNVEGGLGIISAVHDTVIQIVYP